MAKVTYYSAKEPPKNDRVYHTYKDCQSGRQILAVINGKPPKGYKLCEHCEARG